MKTLSHQLKPLFVEAAQAAFPDLSAEDLEQMVTVEEPRDASHGDYSCPLAMRLAKRLGRSPMEIGEKLVICFPQDFRVGSLECVAPGFVNLRLHEAYLEELLKELEGGFQLEDTGEHEHPVIVEYTSTNAAKQAGVHHTITAFLGDSLANLFDFMGYEVMRLNHLGDWGTNFGQLIYGVETWGDREVIHKNPCEELNKLYVKFHAEAEEKPELMDEARRIFKELEEGDEEKQKLWEWIVQESIRDLDATFARVGVHVKHMGESFYLDKTDAIIEEGIERGLFVEGEGGSLIYEMGEKQVPALIRKSDGTTLYLTRDIATVKYRVETWSPEAILYVVDHAQSLHFKQDFTICKALGYEGETSLEHISFGRMSFADRSMSTRKGHTIKLTEVLDEGARRAAELAAERGTELPREEFAAVAEAIGIASIKYAILSQDRNKDIIFDWEKIITLEGNSAPYLLYSYARAKRVVKKAGEVELKGIPKLSEDVEWELMRSLVKFPEVLERALAERKPHGICFYLYDLCQQFNRFYGECRVADVDDEVVKRSRVGLVQAFMDVQKTGLGVLGIPVLERM